MSNLLGMTLAELMRSLASKKVNAEDVREHYLNRIKKHDTLLNCYITVVEKADAAKEQGTHLAGIPLAVKDNYCTQGVRTTAASKVLADFIPPYESTVTGKLWDSGATLLGKTNLDAWSHGSSTETSDFGTTKNPYDTTRIPGGSSGGSAAAVAAGLAPAAIGSETGGSIRCPASWSGVVGIKPTYGRASRYGLIAMGSSWDCPGTITQTVEDGAILLTIMAGHDRYDGTSSEKPVDDYVKELHRKDTYTIGVADEYFEGVDKEISAAVMAQIESLTSLGHSVKKVQLMSPDIGIQVYTILQRSEVASNLARYDGIRYGNSRKSFGQEAERRIMLGTYVLSHGYHDAFYNKAAEVREYVKSDFARAFADVDFILAPTMPIDPLKIGESEKYPFFGELMDKLAEPSAAAGIPAVTLPIGLSKAGLPIGLQIMARAFDEGRMLNLAQQVEVGAAFDRTTVMKKYE